MVDEVLTWLPAEQHVRLLLDSGYMNRTMLRGLPLDRVTGVGSLKTNAALFRPLPTSGRASPKNKRGRRRKKGQRLPAPATIQRDRRWGWTWIDTSRAGKVRRREALSLRAQWYGVLGERLVHVVLVREDEEKLRVVLGTDPTWSAQQLLEQGARRWAIEVWNRDSKQVFGFADSPAWREKAVLRTAPWVGLLSGTLVVWFHRLYEKGMAMPLPERPWYTWKKDLTFADLVRAAQQILRPVDALGWAVDLLLRCPSAFDGAAAEQKTVGCPSTETHEKTKAA